MKLFCKHLSLLLFLFSTLQAPNDKEPSFFKNLFSRRSRQVVPQESSRSQQYFSGIENNNSLNRRDANIFSKFSQLKSLLNERINPISASLLRDFASQQMRSVIDFTIFPSLEGNSYLQKFYSASFRQLEALLLQHGLLFFSENLSFEAQNTVYDPALSSLNQLIFDSAQLPFYNSLLFQIDVSSYSFNVLSSFVSDFKENLCHSFFELDFALVSGGLFLQIRPLSSFLEISRKNLIASNRRLRPLFPQFIEPEDFDEENNQNSTQDHFLAIPSSSSRPNLARNYSSTVFDLPLPRAPHSARPQSLSSEE